MNRLLCAAIFLSAAVLRIGAASKAATLAAIDEELDNGVTSRDVLNRASWNKLETGTSTLGKRRGRRRPSRKGLKRRAEMELRAQGGDKYLGLFEPVATEEVGNFTIHTFDPLFDPQNQKYNGPVCIATTPYSVATRSANPRKLLIFLQGGGACWRDFYFCNVRAEDQLPSTQTSLEGIFDFDRRDNPYRDYSLVYLPYCDGSGFVGDNDVLDINYAPGGQPVGFRLHRGFRNLSAGIDLAKKLFPNAKKISVVGHSAGGVGACTSAAPLVRLVFGNNVDLTVFNDAGPVAVNLDDASGVQNRADDWQFDKFYPPSCVECDALDQGGIDFIEWYLNNDRTVRFSFFSTDGDVVGRRYLTSGNIGELSALEHRDLILTEHGRLNEVSQNRYKRFIIANETDHGAIQLPRFYTTRINNLLLRKWTAAFLKLGKRWVDRVEPL